ncbi:solute carrier family 25 member 48 isoform X5 [Eptesicus fuscus]|uniref:solute carrier family 25 member 48 isoform X5 n=1 Tax=Eptesicus fuscus TaxID=29078 RepID=UPI00240432B1|nr:solute carrier family 25 member 48 isoform X5 [Eptesicus fuscus]
MGTGPARAGALPRPRPWAASSWKTLRPAGSEVFGFFKGMSFPLASIAVYNSVVFGVFSNTQRFLSQHHSREPEAGPPHTLSDLLLASMVAGVVSVGLGTPVDLIKIRLQMQTQPFRETSLSLKPRAVALGEQPAYQGPVHCIATIVRTEGLAGLYRGAGAMMLRDVPGYCLYFIPYVFLTDWITPEACADPSPYAVWLAGGVAGAISWGTATPMDVVKSRLQADGVYLNKYKGVLDCISQSYQKEGLKGQGWCHGPGPHSLQGEASPQPAHLRTPSFRLQGLCSSPPSWTIDRSPPIFHLHWHLAKSGPK